MGTEKRPVPKLSKLFEEYEAVTKDEVKDLSPDQLRIWRNGRIRAVDRFVDLIGDKLLTEITEDDAHARDFNGLERQVVILAASGGMADVRGLPYVALSRPRVHLSVFGEAAMISWLQGKLG